VLESERCVLKKIGLYQTGEIHIDLTVAQFNWRFAAREGTTLSDENAVLDQTPTITEG
jgi:hypothetical protein